MSWAVTIIGLAALIILHELGHFAVAKAVGMRVERFSLFFPPTIARLKRGETEYAIGALPLGGYVKITGMSPEELRKMDLRIAHRAYYSQAPWRRIAVILAGPGVNILIAFALFWAVLYSGGLNGALALSNLNPSVQTLTATTRVMETERGMPADGVLQAGDEILAVDGHRVRSSEAIERLVGAHRCSGVPNENCRSVTPVKLTVKRGRRELSLSIYPRYDAARKRMLVGFDFMPTVKPFGVISAAGAVGAEMWGITKQTLTNFERALRSSKVRHKVSSIVGITQDAQQTVVAGPGYALVFFGFISLILAVINLFPFLPLDGGHILWSAAEKLRGRRISLTAMWSFSSVGIVALAFLVINGFSNDITRLGG